MKQAPFEKEKLAYPVQEGIPVMEMFYTLQGEGAWTGTPSYFLRLAGCDVGCIWCDVKESWTISDEQFLSYESILNKIQSTDSQRVVITGGEPTLHNLEPLTSRLQAVGLKVHLETSGVYPLRGNFDWICFSPKKFVAPLNDFFDIADELKVIVYSKHDLKWAEELAQRCSTKTALFLQPEWTKMQRFLPEILHYIKQNPSWRLSLQTHKWIDIP